MESTVAPLSGLWKPNKLEALYYGPGVVKDKLLSCFPSENSKAFIITGSSLASKTSLIRDLEILLTPSRHAGTFANIKQHAPVAQLDEAAELVAKDSSIDTIISVGGGSPIDSAKAISYRQNEKTGEFHKSHPQPPLKTGLGKFLYHIAIPTTLSAAECTTTAGYTKEDGLKTGISHPGSSPSVILYDSQFALQTPQHLWLSTAIRSLDHAVELLYHPTSTEIPCRQMALEAISTLFDYLPKSQSDPKDENVIMKLYLAAFGSLGFLGLNVKGPLGLSHTMGYALGSPYGIPHGVTSCITLGHVVKLKANSSPMAAAQLARALPFIGQSRSGNDVVDAELFGDKIVDLITRLGLNTTLTDLGVDKDQVEVITQRATGGETQGPLFDSVKTLVGSFY